MRVSFYGSSLVSCYWNGAATYYRGLLRRARRPRAPDHLLRARRLRPAGEPRHPGPGLVPGRRLAGHAGGHGAGAGAGRGADLVVKASGVGVFDADEAAVLGLRRADGLAVFWDVDAPATLDRVEGDPADPFAALIPRYDLVFTYGGGDPVVRAYERLGARRCVPIYNALDPATHFPVPRDPRFAAELGFLGNRLPDREARVDEFFFAAAQALPRARFLLGGAGWGERAHAAQRPLSGPRRHACTTRSTARPGPCSTSTAPAWRPTASRRRPGCSRPPVPAPA